MDDRSVEERAARGSLPAPYANPWSTLGENLRAVVADLRLRVRELWRRNREGDLSTPGFWPQDLAPLFWPLSLLLLLLLIGGLAAQLLRQSPQPSDPPEQERLITTALPEARTLPLQSLPLSSIEAAPETPETPSERLSAPVSPPGPEPAPSPIDPLLSVLRDDDDLLLAARPQAGSNGVVLVVSKAWLDLSDARRQQRASAWWERLQAEGFSDLSIEDGDQVLLARTARVGSGMIVFDPQDR